MRLTATPLCHAATLAQFPVPAGAVLVGVAVVEVVVVLGSAGTGQVFPRTAVIHAEAASGYYQTNMAINPNLFRGQTEATHTSQTITPAAMHVGQFLVY